MDYNLSNFYKEYSDNPQSFNSLFQGFEEVFSMIGDYSQQISDDLIVNKSSTYRKVPYQRIDVTESTYELNSLLLSEAVAMQFSLKEFALYDRIDKWNNEFSVKQKMDALDLYGATIMMMSLKDISDSNKDTSPDIVDFELYDDKGNRMIKNLDYGFKNNILYLFRKIAQKDSTGKRIIILKNIFLDYNNPEKTLGSNIGIPYDETFTKNEYRDVMQSFIYASLGGPTIKNLNDSFGTISYKEGFAVYDHRTSDNIKKTFWLPKSDGRQYGIYDFLVSMPIEAYYDKDKYDLIKKYLEIIKPAYANFTLSPEIIIKEILNMRAKEREVLRVSSSKTLSDKLVVNDKQSQMQKTSPSDKIVSAGNIFRYDDPANIFDDDGGCVISDLYNPNTNVASVFYADKVSILLIKKS